MNLLRYNFETDEYDDVGAPDTDDEAKKYIPQSAAAQNLYELYRLQGDSILDASINVLKACIGEGN